MTYDELIERLRAWTWDRSDELLAQLPSIIRLGERTLATQADLRSHRKYGVPETITAGTNTLALPSDCLYMRAIYRAADDVEITEATETWIREYRQATGIPRYYAQSANAPVVSIGLEFAPRPLVAVPILMSYTADVGIGLGPEPERATSWLSLYAEDALLYSCIKHGLSLKYGTTPILDPAKAPRDVDVQYATALESLRQVERLNRAGSDKAGMRV